jgi:Ca2+-binding RTX toxin-like protein
MPSVTIAGGAGETIAIPFQAGPNALFAQYLADGVSQAVKSGALKPVNYTGGVLPPATPGVDEEVVIRVPGTLILPSEATTVVNTADSVVLFGGGAANETIISADLTFFTNGGSGNIVVGAGNNRIVQTGIGPWNINTGSGNDQIFIAGGANTISPGGGDNAVLLSGGNNLVLSTGRDTVQAVAGNDTIVASGSNPILVEGVTANLTFVGGSGAATVLGGQGSATVFATAGGDFRGGTAGHNLIVGGDGPTTIVGGGSGDVLDATGSGPTRILAASGNETLDASLSSGNNTLQGGSGSDQIIGGFGNDTMIAGTGASTMQGGAGHDVFQFINGTTANTLIVDFLALDGDKVNLVGYASNEVQHALAHASIGPDGTTLTLSDQTKITFANTTDLNKSNFS